MTSHLINNQPLIGYNPPPPPCSHLLSALLTRALHTHTHSHTYGGPAASRCLSSVHPSRPASSSSADCRHSWRTSQCWLTAPGPSCSLSCGGSAQVTNSTPCAISHHWFTHALTRTHQCTCTHTLACWWKPVLRDKGWVAIYFANIRRCNARLQVIRSSVQHPKMCFAEGLSLKSVKSLTKHRSRLSKKNDKKTKTNTSKL